MKKAFFSILAALCGAFPSVAFAQAPANNNFANAIVISGGNGSVSGTNVLATLQSGEPTTVQGFSSGASVWFNWTAPATSLVTFQTLPDPNTTFDSQLAIYTGSAVNALTLVGESDFFAQGNPNGGEVVQFNATQGTIYRVRITGFQGATGTFAFDWSSRPANDDFAGPEVISGVTGTVAGNDEGATSEGQLEDELGPVVWYQWTAPITGVVRFSVPEGIGHFVDVFRGTTYGNKVSLTGNTVSFNPLLVSPPLAPAVNASVTAGVVYQIAVGGGGVGFDLSWQTTTNGVLSLAGTQRFFDLTTGVDGVRFVADEKGGPITVKVRRTGGLDGVVSATYQVTTDLNDEFAFDNAANGTDFTAATGTVTFQAGEAEKSFTVAIVTDTTDEPTEDFVITLSNPSGGALLSTAVVQAHLFDDENDPANDDFVNAQPLFGVAGTALGDNTLADVEATETPLFVGPQALIETSDQTLWYRWTPPASGVATFSALISGNPREETIDVFTAGPNGLQLVTHGGLAFTANFNTVFQPTVFQAESGRVYFVRLAAFSAFGSTGPTELTWSTVTGGVISLGTQSFAVTEGVGAAYQVVVSREGGLANGAAVVLTTSDNSADSVGDYTAVNATVVFNPGEATKTVTIPILNDADLEGDEVFDVTLSDANGGVLGNNTFASVTIFDDEDDPTNDLFIARKALPGSSGTESGSTEGAGSESSEPSHGVFSVWYRWTAPGGPAGVATFAFTSVGMPGPTITIYTGTAIDGLTKVAQAFGQISFLTTPGTAYIVAITDRGADNGLGGLDFAPSPFDLSYGFNATGSVISFTNATMSVAETAATLTVSLTRAGSTVGAATVDFDFADITTTPGADFTYAPGTASFADGEATTTFTVAITNDTFVEGDETFSISLTNPVNAVLAGSDPLEATATILDDDDDLVPPGNDNFASAVLLAGSNPVVTGFTAGATVEASEPSVAGAAANSSVWYRWVAPGTGAARLTLNSATNFTSAYTGATLANLTEVALVSPGAFAVTSGTTYFIPVNASAGSDFELTINFSAAGLFSFAPASLTVLENNGPAVVTILRTNGTSGAVSVRFRTQSLTAQAGSDFTTVDTIVNFASGVGSQSVNVPITNDTLEEGAETAQFILSDPTGGAIVAYGPDQVVTLRIQDDETAPPNDNFAAAIALSGPFGTTFGSNIDGSTEAGEPTHAGAGTGASLWYRWTAPANGTVTFQTTGSNIPTVLAAYTGSVVSALNPVAASAVNPSTISFTAVAGTSYALAVDSGSATRGRIALGWNLLLPGVISFSPTSYAVNESGVSIVLTVVRGVGADGAVAVQFATANGSAIAGQDFTTTTGTLNFANGETTKTITVPITNDTAFETAESFTVVLTAPTNGAVLDFATATVNVTSNDPFVANAANFAALINSGGTHTTSGLLTMRVSVGGGFSGILSIGGQSDKFSGGFDSFGKALVRVPRKKGLTAVSVEIQITDGGKAIIGRAYDGTFDSALAGNASFFDKKVNLYPGAGTYTLACSPTATGATIPQGIGTAPMKVGVDGVISIKGGQLADGSKLDGTIGFIAQNGQVQFYKALYSGTGSLSGVVTFRNQTLTDADGTLAWFKPANAPKEKLFLAGFTTSVSFAASKYLAPAKGLRIDNAFDANAGAATTLLTSGGLVAPVTINSPLTTANTITAAAPAFSLAGASKDGTFSGKFTPAGGTEGKIKGVFLQKSNKAVGQFFGVTLSGSIQVTPTP